MAPPPRSPTKERLRLEKEMFAALGRLVRQTQWKKKDASLFMQSGDYFQEAFVSVGVTTPGTEVTLKFKPMALDPILWDILDMAENRSEPLSFRAWGAFTCSSLPIASAQVEQPGSSAADIARAVLDYCESNADLFRAQLAEAHFSALVAKHPYQVERGVYAVTLVTSLIHEGQLDAARRTTQAYASGEKSAGFDLASRGESFHQLAAKWLESRP